MKDNINFHRLDIRIGLFEVLICLLVAILIVNLQFLVFDQIEFYSDNYYYKLAFEELRLKDNIALSYLFFVWRTSGSEPISFFIFYLFSFIFDYKTFIFYVDVIFYTCICIFFRKQRMNFLFVFYFAITNYYFLIMSIGVHRIKLAFIFFFLILIVRKRWRKIFMVITPLVHFQMFSVYFSILIGIFLDKLFEGKLSRFTLIAIVGFTVLIIALASFTKIMIKFFGKLDFYVLDSLVSFLLAFLFIKIINIKNRQVILYLVCISIFTSIVGGYRMNMVLFLSFIVITAYINQRISVIFNFFASFYMMLKIYILYNGHYLENLIYNK